MKTKFRGFSERLNKWVYGYLVEDNMIVNGIVEVNDQYISIESWETVVPESVGQYAGLKDLNGVEIYEGDVVRVTHAEYFIDKICTVVWGLNDNGSYPAFHMPELDTESNSFSEVFNVDGYDIKIIGNIYQNKEILEDE